MAFSELHYFSNSLGQQMTTWAILPDTAGPFSVLYLLHGRSDDHTTWTRRTSIERYADGWSDLMVVMPDSGRGFSCDAVNGPAHQGALIQDLIPFIDRTFRTRPERSARAIGGLSMGGYGAIKIALQFPALFGSAHSHSGALDFAHGFEPGSVENRLILGDAITGGGPNDPYRLAAECPHPPALLIDCGTDDFLIEHNRSFHTHLEKLGIAHEYHEYPGAHTWDYWDLHIRDALAFHGRHLGWKRKS
jgi:putative tributyrin esterase